MRIKTPPQHTFEARDYVDELTSRKVYTALKTRDLFADISTRELIDELSDRLERRGPGKFACNACGQGWPTRSAGESTTCKISKSGKHVINEMP
ncbi:hypothetical protein DFP72DRAFT_1073582 [Ephemerocybe angulata]|uniref:Uncharacterized protein n=1 Tax=Ephemerocybe angulata TaxID=980116 RepID=A0A8H6LZY3_9AGAR|nr:hypothetical protein DFP72DRAFT_1073582 [Tulosesus angulatus]